MMMMMMMTHEIVPLTPISVSQRDLLTVFWNWIFSVSDLENCNAWRHNAFMGHQKQPCSYSGAIKLPACITMTIFPFHQLKDTVRFTMSSCQTFMVPFSLAAIMGSSNIQSYDGYEHALMQKKKNRILGFMEHEHTALVWPDSCNINLNNEKFSVDKTEKKLCDISTLLCLLQICSHCLIMMISLSLWL